MKSSPINLDAMLTPEQAAKWLQLEQRDFDAKSRTDAIPTFRIGFKTRRYHPRTVIVSLARKAGVPVDLIAASFNITKGTK